jgi:hypothetical protein
MSTIVVRSPDLHLLRLPPLLLRRRHRRLAERFLLFPFPHLRLRVPVSMTGVVSDGTLSVSCRCCLSSVFLA